ncbi:MAG: DUF1326 domain-containing protein [Gemmatimonadota bacterium]|jgi:hypothetical protein|nr:DUF1326 domain-containing protein [Gemmatimonadota bacterium]
MHNGRYDLTGDFVECCDCFTICPCWVSEIPDEDHCSGLYVWTFAAGSRIDGIDVSGMSIAAASFHAVRSGGQSLFFLDTSRTQTKGGGRETDPELAYDAILNAFTGVIDRQDPGRDPGQFATLGKLLGTIIGNKRATITSTFEDGHFKVSVSVAGVKIAAARGKDWVFQGEATPMSLSHTALTDELGIQSEVRVQQMEKLTVNVAALPGGPLEFRGRAGMRGKFHYQHRPTRQPVLSPRPPRGEE